LEVSTLSERVCGDDPSILQDIKQSSTESINLESERNVEKCASPWLGDGGGPCRPRHLMGTCGRSYRPMDTCGIGPVNRWVLVVVRVSFVTRWVLVVVRVSPVTRWVLAMVRVGRVGRWVLVCRSVSPGLHALSNGRDGSLVGQERPEQDQAFPRWNRTFTMLMPILEDSR
jgi:hypothetical protein